MRKIILASVAAFALTGGYANAQGIIRDHDENDRSQWINLWAGESEDEAYFGRRDGSSASTFSGGRGFSMKLDTDENDKKPYFFFQPENRS